MEAVLLTLQIFLTIVIGFVARKFKVVDGEFRGKLAPFLIDVGMPCLIIGTFAGMEFDAESFRSGLALMGIGLLVLALLFVMGLIFKWMCRSKEMGAVAQVAIMFPNYMFMGIPIASGLFGSEGLFYFMMFVTPIELLYYITIPFMLAQGGKKKFDRKALMKILLSPPIVSIFVALIIYVNRISLPGFVSNALSNMTALVSTMGVVLVGVSVADTNIKSLFKRWENILLPIFIDVLSPVIILFLLKLLFGGTLPAICIAVAVLFAALPGGATTVSWSARYCGEETTNFAAVGIVTSTLLCVVTLPAVSMLIDRVLF